MKAFASALLLAGAHAAAGAIDFGTIKAESKMASLSSPIAFLSKYGPKNPTTVKVINTTKVSYEVSTDHAKKQYTLKMIMVAAHEDAYKASNKNTIEIYQCWKDGVAASSSAGLKGVSCHVLSVAGTADGACSVLYKIY